MARYPVPDRSNFKPNQLLSDEKMPEGDIGTGGAILSAGRPYVIEAWFSESEKTTRPGKMRCSVVSVASLAT